MWQLFNNLENIETETNGSVSVFPSSIYGLLFDQLKNKNENYNENDHTDYDQNPDPP